MNLIDVIKCEVNDKELVYKFRQKICDWVHN